VITIILKYCPGIKALVSPKIMIVKCPYCGGEVEFFEYEIEAECPDCGRIVRREPSEVCVSWCNMADKCIDELEQKGIIDKTRAEELRKFMWRFKRRKS